METPSPEHLLKIAAETTPSPSTAYLDTLKEWLAAMAEHYRVEMSELSLALYVEGLRELSPATLRRACFRAVKECRFMPTVADILRCADPQRDDPMSPKLSECELCGGTGWTLRPHPSGCGQAAHKCTCGKGSQ